MHEMALAESILEVVEQAARAQQCTRVTEIRLEIGALAGIEVSALRFGLEVVLAQSLAHGARVEIDTLVAEGWCLRCSQRVPLNALHDPCPTCGGYQIQPLRGTEMRVKDILAL